MKKNEEPFQVAILLYPGLSALDAVGPYEVFSRMPNTEIRFVGKETGPLMTEGGVLFLGVTHRLFETPSPDLVFVPGGTTTPGQMLDDEVLDWLRKVHETSTWTASDCSGSLILAAAGILKGLPATTHWIKMGVLKSMGTKPEPNQRIVRSGKIVTAAGVSAGIDLALWLAGEITGREGGGNPAVHRIRSTAAVQFWPHDQSVQGDAEACERDDGSSYTRRPARLVPKIAWRRFLDRVRTGT